MKTIKPVNEEAVRQARDEQTTAAPGPIIDSSKIYHAAVPHIAPLAPPNATQGQNSVSGGVSAPPAPNPTPGTAPAQGEKYTGPLPTVAFRDHALKLYATVLLLYGIAGPALEILNTGLATLFRNFSVHLLVSILLYTFPLFGGIYLLYARSVTTVRAVLIVLGIGYGFQIASVLSSLSFLSGFGFSFSPILIFTFSLPIIFAIWTYKTFRSVTLLEDY